MLSTSILGLALLTTASLAQEFGANDGYTGYKLDVRDTDDSVSYETANTDTSSGLNSNATLGPPDVYLNASVNVGTIAIGVQNLSAKINLDAQVLQLLQFSAGVDVSIERVDLTIENVTAKVLLEARLGNLVAMVDDVLSSVDLNPLIASLGSTVGEVGEGLGSAVGGLGGALGGALNGSSATPTSGNNITARGVDDFDRVLYSSNDYSGNTHKNRVLESNGDIVDQFLDNEGRVKSQTAVGNYATDFTFNGESREVTVNGQLLTEKEYVYQPYYGLRIVSLISFDASGQVVNTRVLSELSAGGTSTISAD